MNGIIDSVNVAIIERNDIGPVIALLLKKKKLSAGQLSK